MLETLTYIVYYAAVVFVGCTCSILVSDMLLICWMLLLVPDSCVNIEEVFAFQIYIFCVAEDREEV